MLAFRGSVTAQAVETIAGIGILKAVAKIHGEGLAVPDFAPEPAIPRGRGVPDHERPVVGAAEFVRRNVPIAGGGHGRKLLLDNHRAVGDSAFASIEQPAGDLRRIKDSHRRMNDGIRAIDERPRVADPLVSTPGQLTVFESAQVAHTLLLKLDRLTGLELLRDTQFPGNRLSVRAGIDRRILRNGNAGQKRQRENCREQNRFTHDRTPFRLPTLAIVMRTRKKKRFRRTFFGNGRAKPLHHGGAETRRRATSADAFAATHFALHPSESFGLCPLSWHSLLSASVFM